MKKIIIGISLIALAVPVYAQLIEYSTAAVMGAGYVAGIDNANALFLNPANLADLNNREVALIGSIPPVNYSSFVISTRYNKYILFPKADLRWSRRSRRRQERSPERFVAKQERIIARLERQRINERKWKKAQQARIAQRRRHPLYREPVHNFSTDINTYCAVGHITSPANSESGAMVDKVSIGGGYRFKGGRVKIGGALNAIVENQWNVGLSLTLGAAVHVVKPNANRYLLKSLSAGISYCDLVLENSAFTNEAVVYDTLRVGFTYLPFERTRIAAGVSGFGLAFDTKMVKPVYGVGVRQGFRIIPRWNCDKEKKNNVRDNEFFVMFGYTGDLNNATTSENKDFAAAGIGYQWNTDSIEVSYRHNTETATADPKIALAFIYSLHPVGRDIPSYRLQEDDDTTRPGTQATVTEEQLELQRTALAHAWDYYGSRDYQNAKLKCQECIRIAPSSSVAQEATSLLAKVEAKLEALED